MTDVNCNSLSGGDVTIPAGRLQWRPSVYGLALHEGCLLVVRMRSTSHLFVPGGGVEPGESLEDALRREMREEVGIEVAVERLAGVAESFFYCDPEDAAYHCLAIFYLCRPRTFEFLDDAQIDDGEANDPHWIPIETLNADDFKVFGREIIAALQSEPGDSCAVSRPENAIHVCALDDDLRPWATRLLAERWGSAAIVTRGVVHDGGTLPALVATRDGKPAGLATYRVAGDECELVSLDSLIEGIGVGTRLIVALRKVARSAGCRRLWLITTNDNVAALRFYQRRGFALVAVHRNALDASRRLKPEIPLIGLNGIPLRDEIELELRLLE